MESRRSIPNVGPRAQGRKALFMLKGSGVHILPSPEDTASRTHRPAFGRPLAAQQQQGSLTVAGDEGGERGRIGGELGEPPVTYDESVLSQPSHPYNRIIQRILHRHREADTKKEGPGHLTPRTDMAYNQGTASSSSSPYTGTNQTSRSSNILQSKAAQIKKELQECSGIHLTSRTDRDCSQPPREDPEDDGDSLTSSRNHPGEEDEANSEADMQWADILQADHCVKRGDVDPLDLRACDGQSSSPEDQSVSSLDLVKGYLMDRSFISDHPHSSRENDLHGGLDTTRSELTHHHHPCLLPRLVRRRDLQSLDDVLDYFWVYQGMSRQLLDRRHYPGSPLTSREPWDHNASTKLPPLYLARGPHSQPASSENTGSSPSSSRPRSQRERERSSERGSRHRSGKSTVPGCNHPEMSEARTQNSHRAVYGGRGENGTGRSTVWADEAGERSQGRRVTLVVKMPVLTRESSCSDVLEHE